MCALYSYQVDGIVVILLATHVDDVLFAVDEDHPLVKDFMVLSANNKQSLYWEGCTEGSPQSLVGTCIKRTRCLCVSVRLQTAESCERCKDKIR